MKPGVTALVLPTEWDLQATIAGVRAAGYTAVELVLRDAGFLRLEMGQGEYREIGTRIRDAGLELAGICPALRLVPRDLMTADEQARRQGVATVRECMRVCADVGAGTMLLVLGTLTPDLYYDAAYENALRSVRELAPAAEELGVKLAIEYVWNKFLLSPLEFARFCDEVGSPHVGFYFDPGNMAVFGYPEQWVRICSRHLMAVHMKDFRRKDFTWTPLGQGDVDFAAVMAELRRTGFDGPLVSEVEPSLASLEETCAAIKRIMAL